jgi:hypothetical protein
MEVSSCNAGGAGGAAAEAQRLHLHRLRRPAGPVLHERPRPPVWPPHRVRPGAAVCPLAAAHAVGMHKCQFKHFHCHLLQLIQAAWCHVIWTAVCAVLGLWCRSTPATCCCWSSTWRAPRWRPPSCLAKTRRCLAATSGRCCHRWQHQVGPPTFADWLRGSSCTSACLWPQHRCVKAIVCRDIVLR